MKLARPLMSTLRFAVNRLRELGLQFHSYKIATLTRIMLSTCIEGYFYDFEVQVYWEEHMFCVRLKYSGKLEEYQYPLTLMTLYGKEYLVMEYDNLSDFDGLTMRFINKMSLLAGGGCDG